MVIFRAWHRVKIRRRMRLKKTMMPLLKMNMQPQAQDLKHISEQKCTQNDFTHKDAQASKKWQLNSSRSQKVD
jgi:hypothetical protein